MKSRILELRQKGYTYKQITEELGISKATISYHCKPYNIDVVIPASIVAQMQPLYDKLKSTIKVAKELGVSKTSVLKYIKTDKKHKLDYSELSKRNVGRVVSFRQRKKKELVEYKGGSCSRCGYNKSIWALQFHHLDPKEKDFTVTGKSWSFDKLKAETDKCILLCANCHFEEHERIHIAEVDAVLAKNNKLLGNE